jgi:ABC-type branched-subunit amino acid transport system substrate-binding protein
MAFLVGVLVGPATVQGQVRDSIPRNSDAELMFEQGLAAFEQGRYQRAAERFRLVNDYQLNRKTTAALVMQGKALLQLGRFQETIDVLTTLLDRYPQTSYREEAERILKVGRTELQRQGQRVDTLRIGILLPMTNESVGWSQAMFNGIRLAVDEHNGLRRRYVPPPGLRASVDSFGVARTAAVYGDSLAEAEGRMTVTTQMDTVRVDSLQIVTEQQRPPEWVAKMHFRRVEDRPESARTAVDSLVRVDDVDVILGPLRSEMARPAGGAAEDARLPLIAPLATNESVSAGRDYVFQANPTIPLRGRIMARFASKSLLTESVSVIYEDGTQYSKQMAEAFQEEAQRQGLQSPFALELANPRQWSQLPEALEADSTVTDSMFAATEAFYVPIVGRNATGKIQDALTGFGRLNTTARLLGNSSWHNLSVVEKASAFTTTYATDFNVQTGRPEVQTFIRRYRLLTGNTPGQLSVRGQRLAYTGYDIARFLLTTIDPSPPPPSPQDLREAPTYEGLGVRIDFEGGNVNRAMFFQRYRNNRIERIR